MRLEVACQPKSLTIILIITIVLLVVARGLGAIGQIQHVVRLLGNQVEAFVDAVFIVVVITTG